MAQRNEPTAWVGWVFFGAAMMLIIGMMHVIAGLVGVYNNDFYVATSNAVIAFDFTTWGWIHLVAGVLLLATGVGVLAGAAWARVSGVILTSVAVLINVSFLSVTPIWSLVGVVLGCLVVYALAMHGQEIEE